MIQLLKLLETVQNQLVKFLNIYIHTNGSIGNVSQLGVMLSLIILGERFS